MDTTTRTGSPLRQRMLDDMRMRRLQPRTQASYIRAVRRLTLFLERAPDTATADDLRRFQLHLVDQGASPITDGGPTDEWQTAAAAVREGETSKRFAFFAIDVNGAVLTSLAPPREEL